jgi:hypothetical protein
LFVFSVKLSFSPFRQSFAADVTTFMWWFPVV